MNSIEILNKNQVLLLLDQPIPPLLIDTRPLVLYQKSRILNAVHLTIPPFLLNRFKRKGYLNSSFDIQNLITHGLSHYHHWLSLHKVNYINQLSNKAIILLYHSPSPLLIQLISSLSHAHIFTFNFELDIFPINLLDLSPLLSTLTVSPTSLPSLDQISLSEIIPRFLYLGPELTHPHHLLALKSKSIKRVLNMAEECDGMFEGFLYLKIPVKDRLDQYVQDMFKKAIDFINDSKRNHEGIYIFCQAGKSRSVAVVLAYLIQSEHWTLKKAYQHLVHARPGISPNIGFIVELLKIEKEIHGQTSNLQDPSLHYPISPQTQLEIIKLEKSWELG